MAGFILQCILLCQVMVDQAAPPLQVDVSVAFAGQVSTGRFTELRVRAFSPDGGNLTLETAGGSPDVSLGMELPRGELTEYWVPIGIDFSNHSPMVHISLDDADLISVPLGFIRHPKPRPALAGMVATQLLHQVPDTEVVSGTVLPRFPPAYGQISALAIDAQALATLDDAQLRALLEFVGTCGRLMLIDVSAAVERAFVNRSSCESRFLRSVDSAGNAEAAFYELLEEPTQTLPSEQQLTRLLTKTSDGAFDFSRLGFFWVGYVVILVVLMMQVRTRIMTLPFSIVCTLLAVVIWPTSGSRAYVAWAEASSADHVARYTGLERHSAIRAGVVTETADSFDSYPTRIVGNNYSLRWDTDSDNRYLVWDASPFQQIAKLTHGSFTVESPLQVGITDNTVYICNSGNGASRQAFLYWQETVFAIPSISPGSMWSSSGKIELDSGSRNSPELQLFLNRSFGNTITLLQPLPISGAGETGRGWLLRYLSGRSGDSSCGK